MTKQDYILKQISKTNKKNFENYVVTRIWHLLDRPDIAFKTQQYVKRENGHALTDMYFPQLKLHIEVDEPFHEKQAAHDLKRQLEIINSTGHTFKRIKVLNNIELLNIQVKEVVTYIESEIEKQVAANVFQPWNYEQQFDPEYYIEKGCLDVDDNPRFRRIMDACNCLGQGYKGNVMGGWFKSKVFPNHHIWFPKFMENNEWDNWMSDDGTIIYEKCKDPNKIDEWYNNIVDQKVMRIAFPKTIDNLGAVFYRFAGIFETDWDSTTRENGMVHKLVNKRIELKNQ